MHFFMIHATPKPGTEQTETVGGAYVNCWINFKLRDGAEVLARHYINQAGWIPDTIEDEGWVEQDEYDTGSEPLSYFQEAQDVGMCLAFHTYPIDEESDSEPDEWND